MPPQDMPPVGGDYDFVVPIEFPLHIPQIDANLFSISRPYPVVNTLDGTDEDDCECETLCVADDGTKLSSSCLNVATSIVCDDTNCQNGDGCGNRFSPRYQLELTETRVGLGAVCYTLIPKNAFVVEYVGEVLYEQDAVARPDRRYQVQMKTKALWGGGSANIYIDALRCGNKSRFLNHSCHPNCRLYEFTWTNTTRLGIFAARDIPPLQELTFDYRRQHELMFQCVCGFADCVSNAA